VVCVELRRDGGGGWGGGEGERLGGGVGGGGGTQNTAIIFDTRVSERVFECRVAKTGSCLILQVCLQINRYLQGWFVERDLQR